jgi:acyl dehydratase
MPFEPSYVGHTYPPSAPYLVGREKIREFADAIGATDGIHRDLAEAKSRGFPDLVAPPTFAIVITSIAGQQVFEDPVLGIDFARLVHGQQRFRYNRPVHAGDKLVAVVMIEDLISRGGHDFVTTRTDVATWEGEPVLTAWSKLVIRGEE